MKKITLLLAWLCTSVTFAQVARLTYVDFNQSKTKEIKALIKKKTQTYNNTVEGEKFYTFQVEAGEKTGQIVRFLFAESYGQIDSYPKEGNDWWAKNITPKVNGYSGAEFMSFNAEASHDVRKPGANTVAKVLFYKIKPGHGKDFWRYRTNIAKAAAELGETVSLSVWNSGIGGVPGRVIVFYAHEDFSGIDKEAEAWPKVIEKYNELFGGSFEDDSVAFRASLEMWGNYSEIWRFLPELSSPLMQE